MLQSNQVLHTRGKSTQTYADYFQSCKIKEIYTYMLCMYIISIQP